MTIYTKAWNRGGSAPGSWTTFEVTECFIRELNVQYDNEQSFDGVHFPASRVYFEATIVFLKEYDSTIRAAIDTFVNADYKRIQDDRYVLYNKAGTTVTFNSSNAVNFVNKGDVTAIRNGASRLYEQITIELITETPQ